MIFVATGHATQGFPRLINAVEALARKGFFDGERVFMQIGYNSSFISRHCEYASLIPFEKFDEYLQNASLVITHAGCGVILKSIRAGKVPVVMPRLAKYGEHVNDHQMELVRVLAPQDLIVTAFEPEDLPHAIEMARRMIGKPIAPLPPSRMIDLVGEAVRELAPQKLHNAAENAAHSSMLKM